ncbi:MAG: aminomethyl-transferring glycine dehydrogenase subunit GcvPA [Candidatus Heimdallarchaeota archaeon]|nr:aminomethyl-transferring glycine dehydrogenase subunit GcvPA [Candidatus Heimdallarchaeota archaeon]MBY8993331.1 aminomethyl-transferring glycine dehydrogenase subunit GcvPA [Candidatus Heimdallarchaeota archaeon]
MEKEKKIIHPYIPNSVPEVKAKMLKEIGVKDIEELYEDIPDNLRFKGEMKLPKPYPSEYGLKKHVEDILAKNKTCQENLSFLGGDCWQHYVPAICDEINQRSEFLTAYAGEPYEDHGRFQACWEYTSMMGDLLEMDVVNVPTFDWGQAASTAIRMAGRITGRYEVLISKSISPDRLKIIQNYCKPVVNVKLIEFDLKTGQLDLKDLKAKISSKTACIYFENPSYLGCIEDQGMVISEIAHKNGALSVVGLDPMSLGVLTPPSNYGADIVCGDVQAFGIHMQFGGGLAGFIATHDDERFVREYPSRLFGITKTIVEGEWGFGDVFYDRTSFHGREEGKEFVGTAAALWGITAGVYLALVGPQGIQEVGQLILQKSQYAAKKLSEIKGVKIPFQNTPHFKEFVVDFSDSGKTVEDVNKSLLEKGIFGGKDISAEFPELGKCAVFSVTEVHSKEDIDRLVQTLDECLN